MPRRSRHTRRSGNNDDVGPLPLMLEVELDQRRASGSDRDAPIGELVDGSRRVEVLVEHRARAGEHLGDDGADAADVREREDDGVAVGVGQPYTLAEGAGSGGDRRRRCGVRPWDLRWCPR